MSHSHSHSSPSSPDVDFHTPISSLREPTEQDSPSSSEDEFYEALEDVPQQVESEHETSGMEISEMDNVQDSLEDKSHTEEGRRATAVTVDSDGVREGVLKQCGELVLVATGQPLCIPITQVSGEFKYYFYACILVLMSVAKLCGGILTVLYFEYTVVTLHCCCA